MSPHRSRRSGLTRAAGVTGVLVLVAAGLALPSAARAAGCAPPSGSTAPSPGRVRNALDGVSALSACNVWAVGGAADNFRYGRTLIDHWNGTAWRQVPSPDPGGSTRANDLYGVTAVSAANIWAVGDYANDLGSLQPLIVHWNGRSWRPVAVPPPTQGVGSLYSVAADSASDVWAVGETCGTCASDETLTYHWNGSTWTQISSPSPDDFAALRSVTTIDASDAWAVGDYFSGTATQTLALHWDGTAWTQATTPDPGGPANPNFLLGAAAAAGTAWAVGRYFDGSGFDSLVLKWDGSAWSQQATANPSTTNNAFSAVVAPAATDVWAVGEAVDSDNAGQTLLEHGDGTLWQAVSSPDPSGPDNLSTFSGAAAISPSELVAVGTYSPGRFTKALAAVVP